MMQSGEISPSNQLLTRQNEAWRRVGDILSSWNTLSWFNPQLLRHRTAGGWWDVLASTRSTLLVTREYEHLVLALSVGPQGAEISYFCVPHPSGLAWDSRTKTVYIAATRNPNQVLIFRPLSQLLPRSDIASRSETQCEGILFPSGSTFYPGSLYLHDLAVLGDQLYGAATGHNAVVALKGDGSFDYSWWPRSIETSSGPRFDRNYLQCNSIAAGKTLRDSFFSASCEHPGRRCPGHRNFTVDGRGVLFSGRNREAIVRGLTRPHSARLHLEQLWVDNSGYGEIGYANQGRLQAVARLPGWTRGLCFHEHIAFVGVSRVLPRFHHYAPGLEVKRTQCGVFAVDIHNGRILGSITWPAGNQIFSVELISQEPALRFPFQKGRKKNRMDPQLLCYAYKPALNEP